MNRSISSLLAILFSLLLALGGSWMFLRARAQSRPLKTAFNHPLLHEVHTEGRKLLLLRNQGSSSALTLDGLKSSVAKLNDLGESKSRKSQLTLGLWLDVRLNAGGQLVLSEQELLSNGKPVELASDVECKAEHLVSLADAAPVLGRLPTVLNLIARRPGLPEALEKIWGKDKPLDLDHVVIQSESEGILKDLREREPRGLYGSSQATLIQLEVLSSIGLAGLNDLKSDILISVVEESGPTRVPRVRAATLAEAHRRGLKRYVGPVGGDRGLEAAQGLLMLGYDGLVVADWKTLEALLVTAPQE